MRRSLPSTDKQHNLPVTSKDKNYHYTLNKVLIIRSFSPLMEDVFEFMDTEFPNAQVDILQVKGGEPMPCMNKDTVKKVYETYSDKGFLYRDLYHHIKMFQGKTYDGVFMLYGTPRGVSRYYNIDIYSLFIDTRYRIGYDKVIGFRVVNAKRFARKTFWYIVSRFTILINIFATVFVFFYSLLWMILLCPLFVFHKSGRNSKS